MMRSSSARGFCVGKPVRSPRRGVAERRDVGPERVDAALAAERALGVLHEEVLHVDLAARRAVHAALGVEALRSTRRCSRRAAPS